MFQLINITCIVVPVDGMVCSWVIAQLACCKQPCCNQQRSTEGCSTS